MKHIANIITGSRIIFGIAILFVPPLSPLFYVLYVTAGLTDMIDGTVARKTNTVSAFGAKLDTIADLVFVAVYLTALSLLRKTFFLSYRDEPERSDI